MSVHFAEAETRNARWLLEEALREDLAGALDLTTSAVIPDNARGAVNIVARRSGVVAGLPIVSMVFEALDADVDVAHLVDDGDAVSPGTVVATLAGSTRSLLIGERTALNFLTHLSGIATMTREFVDRISGTRAKILDTRKTLPGWRALEKYAVRCGGGTNHRFGLYDGVLIKDNHLAAWAGLAERPSVAEAVQRARELSPAGVPIEVEVDSLDQLSAALPAAPDIVLLDNMSPNLLRQAVAVRDSTAPATLLEASGGVSLDTVTEIARTGVDHISIGAITHSAPALDLAFDWKATSESQQR
jgi:nicotinate-nucleotide pyrophosphorylase (carboxylating)